MALLTENDGPDNPGYEDEAKPATDSATVRA
jgi:hypothetical protein